MDRFFSKLDLRDIKIDPYTTSFPPDADETAAEREAVADGAEGFAEVAPEAEETTTAVGDFGGEWSRGERRPHVPAWAPAEGTPTANGHLSHVAAGGGVEIEVVEADVAVAVDAAAFVPGAAVGTMGGNGEVLKVSARSRPSAVAGAIAGVVREVGRAEVQAIGAGATNQAVKAVAIARDYLRETGIEAVCLPAFIDVTIENEDRTAIRLVVEPR